MKLKVLFGTAPFSPRTPVTSSLISSSQMCGRQQPPKREETSDPMILLGAEFRIGEWKGLVPLNERRAIPTITEAKGDL